MKFGHKVLLLGGAVAIGYGLLAWYLPAAARKKEQAVLATRLDAIEGSLAQLLARGADADGGDTESDSLGQPREASLRLTPGSNEERLAEALERLIDTLEGQTALLASARGEAISLDALRVRHPAPDRAALASLHADWTADRDATRAGLQLLSRAEVLARFGAPTEVSEGSWAWDWNPAESLDAQRLRLVLSFDGDYVHDARFSG